MVEHPGRALLLSFRRHSASTLLARQIILILLVARRFDSLTATKAKGLAEASPFLLPLHDTYPEGILNR